MPVIRIGDLTTYAGDTSGSWLVVNDPTNTTTYKAQKEQLLSGNFAGTASYALTASYVDAANVVGLNLNRISSGSVTASVNINSASFQLTSGSSTLLFVSNSGQVGIGTTNPNTLLVISGSSVDQLGTLLTLKSDKQSTAISLVGTDRSATIGIAQRAVGIAVVGIDIGRNSSTQIDSSNVIKYQNGNGTIVYGYVGQLSTTQFGITSNTDLHLQTNQTSSLYISSASRFVAVGTNFTSSTNPLDVSGSARVRGVITGSVASGAITVGSDVANTPAINISGYFNAAGAVSISNSNARGFNLILNSQQLAGYYATLNGVSWQLSTQDVGYFRGTSTINITDAGAGNKLSGFLFDPTITAHVSTSLYAFRSTLSSSADRWNLYLEGSAPNYLAGNVGIGTTGSTAALTIGSASMVIGSNIGYGAIYGSANDGAIQVTTAATNKTQMWFRPSGNALGFNSNYWSRIEHDGSDLKLIGPYYGNTGIYGAASSSFGASIIFAPSTTNTTNALNINGPSSGRIALTTYNSSPIVFTGTGMTVLIGATTGSGHKLFVSGSDVSGSLNVDNALYVSGSRTGIGTSTPSASLDVSGSARITQNLTASRAFISSSNGTASGSTLIVFGSGSAQPVFTVQGSQGELFSVNDSLSGSLFSVNDISGLPIIEAFSDNRILIGSYQAPALFTTVRTTSTQGSNTIYQNLPTASYDGAFFDYTLRSGSNARAGQITAIWSGSSVNYTETVTTDFGDTTGVRFAVIVTGSNMALTGSFPSASWTMKTIVRSI